MDVKVFFELLEFGKNNIDLITKLIDLGADHLDNCDSFDRTPLSWAVCNGHATIVKVLCDTNIKKIDSVNVNKQDTNGDTPLICAVNRNYFYIAELLIKAGAKINARNINMDTPLVCAVYHKNYPIVELLIKSGVDINLHNVDNNTALHIAVIRKYFSIVKLLLESGADYHKKDNKHHSALYYIKNEWKYEEIKEIKSLIE